MKFKIVVFFFLTPLLIIAQNIQKSYETKFVQYAPKIDGILDDLAWQEANVATDFVMFRPESGKSEPENLKSEVKIVYDNEAIYFAAVLHDDKPNEIPMEFQTRDNFGNADFFGIVLNPQNDGINQTEFFVMSSGNQNDAKVLPSGNEDWSWNAVWYSEVKLTEDAWIVEVKIPFSALRFSNEKQQTWSMNFHRRHQKTKDQYSWNFIPRDKGNISQYDGLLTGIKNIKPPLRLSFSPFASASIDLYKGESTFGWNAGMDLKYGISESFTLDATLIPDFGQVAFDDVVLNLGPFETKYSEKRQFFTEGLDLFSKGDFFYTRRVGSTPSRKNQVEDILQNNEEIETNPDEVDMLNALKISGRTKNGWGIGFFNAITKPTKATIRNIDDNTTREYLTEPLANYNVLVIDKQFNKNSSLSLINTDVLRFGDFRDANVTGFLYDIKTKNSKYGIEGGIGMSNIFENQDIITGYEGVFEIGKVAGKHQFDFEMNIRNKNYSKNDLGYQRRNNYFNYELSYSYRIFEPKGNFNNFGLYLWGENNNLLQLDTNSLSYQVKPNLYIGSETGISAWATTKSQFSIGSNLSIDLGMQYDYDEPRTDGRFYKDKPSAGINTWIMTDTRKPLSLHGMLFFGSKLSERQNYKVISLRPRYRANNHLTLQYEVEIVNGNNQKGFVKKIDEDILFGNRDLLTVENSFSTKYSFTTKSSLGLTFRHYWSPVTYNKFYLLNNDGTLTDFLYSENENINYNIWNLDLSYAWELAPGSQFSVLYRNSIFNSDEATNFSFMQNVEDLFKEPLSNQLSFKLIYYIDVNMFKS